RQVKRFDLTSSGQFTLAEQTTRVLGNLTENVEIKAFFPGGDYAPLRDLLVQYRIASGKIRYEFIDPDRQPEIARHYDVRVYGLFNNPLTGSEQKFGTVILSHGDRREKIEKQHAEIGEEDLTNAIIKLGRTEIKKIYFVQGHGEKDPQNNETSGFSMSRDALEAQGYAVGTVNLAVEGGVPGDASVLIMAGPTTAPFPAELEFIHDFLTGKGGGLLLMVDPPPAPSLSDFLEPWGIRPGDNLVLDVSGAGRLMGAGPSIPLVTGYENHPITERFNAMSFFPLTRSIQPAETIPEEVTVNVLFSSNPNSWGETGLDSKEFSFDEGTDFAGPLPLAVAASRQIGASSEELIPRKGRIVVVGTSNFAINSYFQNQGNGNLFLNMVSWLAQDDDLISIRPKPVQDRRILLSQDQMVRLRNLAVFLLPVIPLIIGIAVFVHRRRR
ncbi:MAG TPA: GldG family protein, partial [Acidobacteriota bacterium]|nr:GldG family protein [Acidobacteriota bacterium]